MLGNTIAGSANDNVGGACKNYWGPALRKGTRDPTMLNMILSFSVVTLLVDCNN
jgi:hypothetical protein